MKPKTPFSRLTEAFEKLEGTSSSLKMIATLGDLFSDLSPEEARMTAHLLRGEVAPPHEGLELGLARKLVARAVANATQAKVTAVQERQRQLGDLGDVAQELRGRAAGAGLTLYDLYNWLKQIALTSGEGSQDEKIRLLAEILEQCSAREAKYAVRLVLGTLRLGVGEMTFLYGLSQALTGSKDDKPTLEHAFNVLSDLGEVAFRAKRFGVKALDRVRPSPGKPIRMMLAQRVRKLEEVRKHISGQVHVEYKYDGERLQAHLTPNETRLYSRRQEDITYQFPDVIETLSRCFKGKEAILEGEVVAIDPKEGRLQGFQTLMQRRRKYNVQDYIRKIPVTYFLFDLLYVDGKSLLGSSLSERKRRLQRHFQEKEGALRIASCIETHESEEIESFFSEASSWGAEGVMIKDSNGPYQAGNRGWQWIKFKKAYKTKLADTFDLVVVGGTHGTGRRGGTYGSLLAAAYDPETERFRSFTKVGAGFNDETLARLPSIVDPYRLKTKDDRVETHVDADVWLEPKIVMEVTGAEITVSPVHAAAESRIKRGGLALRFPRFLRWREDKSPEQATTDSEIYDLYRRSR